MGFFLLGRSVDGAINLLSNMTFESRQEALAELARVTAEPAFDRWDDDVLLVDATVGTPVLLVRPAEPLAGPIVPAPEPGAFAALADEEPAQELPPGIQLPHQAAAEPEPQDEIPMDSDDADEFGVIEPLGTLREALARTTEHMEATGIVAPISIVALSSEAPEETPDLTEPSVTSDAGPDGDASHDWPTESPEPPVSSISPDAAPEPPAGFDDSLSIEPDSAGPLESFEPVAMPPTPIWPWATPIEELDSVETLADTRPESPAPVPIDEPENPVALQIDEPQGPQAASEVVVPSVEPPWERDSTVLETALPQPDDSPVGGLLGEGSDFIVLDSNPSFLESGPADADMGEVTTATDPDQMGSNESSMNEPVAPIGDPLQLSDYTCEDCIYLDTCPNRDGRRPEDCGSFQWK